MTNCSIKWWPALCLFAFCVGNARASVFYLPEGDHVHADAHLVHSIAGFTNSISMIPNYGSYSVFDDMEDWVGPEGAAGDVSRFSGVEEFMEVFSDDAGIHMDTRVNLSTQYWVPEGLDDIDIGYAKGGSWPDEARYELELFLNPSNKFVSGRAYDFVINVETYGDPWGEMSWNASGGINSSNYAGRAVTFVAGEWNYWALGFTSLWSQSIVEGSTSSGVRISLLAPSPVPIPAALPLFLSALAGVGWLARRKQLAA